MTDFCLAFMPQDFINSAVSENKYYELAPIDTFVEGIRNASEFIFERLDEFFKDRYESIEMLQKISLLAKLNKDIDDSLKNAAIEMCKKDINTIDTIVSVDDRKRFKNIITRDEAFKTIKEIEIGTKNIKFYADYLITFFSTSTFVKTTACSYSKYYLFKHIAKNSYKIASTVLKDESAKMTLITEFIKMFVNAVNENFSISEVYINTFKNMRHDSIMKIFEQAMKAKTLQDVACFKVYSGTVRDNINVPFEWFKSNYADTEKYNGTSESLGNIIKDYISNKSEVVFRETIKGRSESSSESESSESSESNSESYTNDDSNDDSTEDERSISESSLDDYFKSNSQKEETKKEQKEATKVEHEKVEATKVDSDPYGLDTDIDSEGNIIEDNF